MGSWCFWPPGILPIAVSKLCSGNFVNFGTTGSTHLMFPEQSLDTAMGNIPGGGNGQLVFLASRNIAHCCI